MEILEIKEKNYFEYTDFEICCLKIRQYYLDLKNLAIEMLNKSKSIESIKENSIDSEENLVVFFDENDLDHIKQLFTDINEELSKMRGRHYQATFFGDWNYITPEELIFMIKKLRREVNSRTGFLEVLLFEEEVESNIFSDFQDNNKMVNIKNKKRTVKKQKKNSKNHTTTQEDVD